MRAATPRVIDMAEAARSPESDDRELDSEGKLLTPKQLRARARRKIQRAQRLVDDAHDHMIKPFEEWDMEELARGRPRNAAGKFSGKATRYISREVHERAMEEFKKFIREGMNVQSITALNVLHHLLTDESEARGRPKTPASVKLQAATFMIEHVLGKPQAPAKTEISVRLQSILGDVMVVPSEAGGYVPGQVATRALPGEIVVEEVEDDDEDG